MVTTRDADSSRRGWSRRVALPLAGVVALSLVLGGFERAAAQEAGSGAPAPAPVEAAAVAPVSEPARARADEPRATRAAIAAAALTAAGVIDTAAGLVPAPLPGTPSTPGALAAAAGISEDSLDSASALTTARQTISAHVDALAATVDAATASRDFFVARGNETRARLASSEGLRLPLLIQLGAARVVAAEQVVALRRGARELAGARSTLTALDARLAALQNAPAEPEGAAAAERDRLAAEQARTSEVAERASEAQDRARAERTQAVGATAEAIASRWEALAPRLQAVVDGRVASEQVLEALNARRSEFAEQQVRYTTALRDVKTTEGRRQREALADPLLDDLIAQRREVRAAASNRRAELRTLERALEEAASAAEAQRAASAEIPDGLDADTSDSLRELAAEELRVVVEEQQLAALRLANADTRWRLSEAQINFYARTIDELLPYLSEARADSLFRINGENIREARTNLAERVRGLTVRVKAVVSGEPLLADGRAGWSVSSILTPLITVLLLLVLVRTGPAYRDPVVVWIVSLRQRGPFRRTGPAFLKLGEVLHETAQQTLVVVALVVARRVLPDLPELALLLSWLFWIAAYAWVTRALGVLLIPMTERPAVLVGTPPDELRLGVDLWELTLPTARLLVRTSRLVLLYMVVGRVGLAAARFLFGPGFVFHWAQWTFNAALAAILYFVAWLWRAEIVSRFAAQAPAAAAGLVDWAGKHRDRPYSVLLVALIGVWLLTRGLARVVATWLSGKTVGQMVTNFTLRRRLERAAGDTVNLAAIRASVLPAPYLDVFTDRPLDDEPFVVGRDTERDAVLSAYAHWQQSRSLGSVAVIGDSGGGKTTFANALRRALDAAELAPALSTADADAEAGGAKTVDAPDAADPDEEADTPTRATAPGSGARLFTFRRKRTQSHDVFAWVASAFGSPPIADRDAAVAVIEGARPRAIIVDQCENLFLRTVGGFEGIDTFLDIVALTSHTVFWVLVFDRLPWAYLNRVRDRRAHFREVVQLRPLRDEGLQLLCERRSEFAGTVPLYDRLAGESSSADGYFEVIKTAGGYFRLLADASRGNLRVAMHLWLNSLIREDGDDQLHVTLFARPDERAVRALGDDQLFALTAFLQHRTLTMPELARALDVEPSAAEVVATLLREQGLLMRLGPDGLGIATATFVPVVNRLREGNLLHLD